MERDHVVVFDAVPIRHIKVEGFMPDKVITLRISDGQGECLSPISGKTLKELGESIQEMLDQYPEVESWVIPDTVQPESKNTH